MLGEVFIFRHVKFGQILSLPKKHLAFVNLPLGPLTCCLFVGFLKTQHAPGLIFGSVNCFENVARRQRNVSELLLNFIRVFLSNF